MRRPTEAASREAAQADALNVVKALSQQQKYRLLTRLIQASPYSALEWARQVRDGEA